MEAGGRKDRTYCCVPHAHKTAWLVCVVRGALPAPYTLLTKTTRYTLHHLGSLYCGGVTGVLGRTHSCLSHTHLALPPHLPTLLYQSCLPPRLRSAFPSVYCCGQNFPAYAHPHPTTSPGFSCARIHALPTWHMACIFPLSSNMVKKRTAFYIRFYTRCLVNMSLTCWTFGGA